MYINYVIPFGWVFFGPGGSEPPVLQISAILRGFYWLHALRTRIEKSNPSRSWLQYNHIKQNRCFKREFLCILRPIIQFFRSSAALCEPAEEGQGSDVITTRKQIGRRATWRYGVRTRLVPTFCGRTWGIAGIREKFPLALIHIIVSCVCVCVHVFRGKKIGEEKSSKLVSWLIGCWQRTVTRSSRNELGNGDGARFCLLSERAINFVTASSYVRTRQ